MSQTTSWRGDLIIIWVVLFAVGGIMAYYLPTEIAEYPYFLYVIGIILIAIGFVVLIIWLVKVIRGRV